MLLSPSATTTSDQGYGKRVPPIFTTGSKPLARVTLDLTDETPVTLYAWRSVVNYCIAGFCREISKTAPKLKTAKEQGGVSLARVTPGHCKRKAQKKHNPAVVALVEYSNEPINAAEHCVDKW